MKLNIKQLEKYWSEHSDKYLYSDQYGWGAVLYTGMPVWFNKFSNLYQQKAFRALTEAINLKNKKILDVGCGIGRWSYLLKLMGAKVTAIDLEEKRLAKAKKDIRLKGIKLLQMNLLKLQFNDETFDFINSVTVLQHIPYKEKEQAIKEICRVTKKGGYISIIEYIGEDEVGHMFPLQYESWIQKFKKHKCQMIRNKGCEYFPLLRLLINIQYLLTKRKAISRKEGVAQLSSLQWAVLRIVILLSYPIEEICLRIFHTKYARHAAILFKKME